MRTLERLASLAIPTTFLCAGTGMLWLLRVDGATGSFFERVAAERTAWVGSHVVLLLGTALMLPAAIGLWARVPRGRFAGLATAMVPLLAVAAVLLAGQYALDFAVPSMITVGGVAPDVNAVTKNDPLSGALFYQLPNLTFLALMVLSLTSAWRVPGLARPARVIVSLNWVVVMIGNLIDPTVQRVALLLLAVTHLPIARQSPDG